jgi:ribosomal protein L16 Arg81 hydroxylase
VTSRLRTGRELLTDGGALGGLLAPMSRDEFVSAYLARRPLHIRGHPSKFDWLYDETRLRALLVDTLAGREDLRCTVSALHKGADDQPLTLMTWERIPPESLDDVLADGTTLCVNNISAEEPDLERFVADVMAELGWTGFTQFNCYVSAPGSGADMHWDASITTSLQLSGRKHWRFATEPSLEWPIRPAQLDRAGRIRHFVDPAERDRLPEPDAMEYEEVVLEPGDLLCLPAGTLHAANGLDVSVALNLAIGRPKTA